MKRVNGTKKNIKTKYVSNTERTLSKKGLHTFFTTTNTIPESIHRRMNTYKYIRIYAVYFNRSLPLSSPCATKCEERSKPIC